MLIAPASRWHICYAARLSRRLAKCCGQVFGEVEQVFWADLCSWVGGFGDPEWVCPKLGISKGGLIICQEIKKKIPNLLTKKILKLFHTHIQKSRDDDKPLALAFPIFRPTWIWWIPEDPHLPGFWVDLNKISRRHSCLNWLKSHVFYVDQTNFLKKIHEITIDFWWNPRFWWFNFFKSHISPVNPPDFPPGCHKVQSCVVAFEAESVKTQLNGRAASPASPWNTAGDESNIMRIHEIILGKL